MLGRATAVILGNSDVTRGGRTVNSLLRPPTRTCRRTEKEVPGLRIDGDILRFSLKTMVQMRPGLVLPIG